MQQNIFDKHAIVVRKRTPDELSGLAFFVIRKLFFRLFLLFYLLAIPFLTLCFLVYITFLPQCDNMMDLLTCSAGPNGVIYLLMVFFAMVFSEQFIGSLVTAYLGIWFFRPRDDIANREVFSLWHRCFGQLFFYLVMFRWFYLRSARFLPHLILLEQTPFRVNGLGLNTSKRITWFFRGLIGEEGGGSFSYNLAWFVCASSGFILLFGWGLTLVPNELLWKNIFVYLFYPLFLSLFFFYNIVRDFFCYLNIRIVREGWDMEIAFKAETLRLQEVGDFLPVPTVSLILAAEDRSSQFTAEMSENRPLPPTDTPPTPPTTPTTPPIDHSSPSQMEMRDVDYAFPTDKEVRP